MEVGAGYRQLSKSKSVQVAQVWAHLARNTNMRIATTAQPGELAVMTTLNGISDNLVCSSQSNDGKTTTVTGIQVGNLKAKRLSAIPWYTDIHCSRLPPLTRPDSKSWSSATGSMARLQSLELKKSI
jgi:hypothetical protein